MLDRAVAHRCGIAISGPPSLEIHVEPPVDYLRRTEYAWAMGRQTAIVLYVVAMVVVVVVMDLLFFRNHFWPRLLSNIGIVLLFGAFYLRFLKR